MRLTQWARLQATSPHGLRMGAWYPVAGLSAREAQVRVTGRVTAVPRSILEFRSTPPEKWTVVRGRRNTSDEYLVCPNCCFRSELPPADLPLVRCGRCNQQFAVAWDEAYPRGN